MLKQNFVDKKKEGKFHIIEPFYCVRLKFSNIQRLNHSFLRGLFTEFSFFNVSNIIEYPKKSGFIFRNFLFLKHFFK